MKRAFVTGGTGFLGINLIEALLKKNWRVVALVLPGETIKYIDQSKVKIVRGDILDQESLRSAMPEGENVTVFHLAGMTSMWKKHDDIQYQINVIGTKNICKVSLEKKVKKFIFTSSISAYGYHKCRINEETISNALECKMNYNRTKFLAEKVVLESISLGLNAVILNPCNVIGPYDEKGWSTLIKSVHKGNTRGATKGTATFAHVDSIVEAHIEAVEKGIVGENYLLGGVEVTFKDVIEILCKMLNRDYKIKTVSPLVLKSLMIVQNIKSYFDKEMPLLTYSRYKRLTGNIVCDDSKAKRVLSYKTKSLTEMLLDSYEWLKREELI